MTKEEVISLMTSSKNHVEWADNCDKVKEACNGYPDFWYAEIIASGLCNEVLGERASDMKIINF